MTLVLGWLIDDQFNQVDCVHRFGAHKPGPGGDRFDSVQRQLSTYFGQLTWNPTNDYDGECASPVNDGIPIRIFAKPTEISVGFLMYDDLQLNMLHSDHLMFQLSAVAENPHFSVKCDIYRFFSSLSLSCRTGYTGVRCDMYNLPQSLDILKSFTDGVIDTDMLSNVVEATARYTVNAALEEDVLAHWPMEDVP
ncbi:hypothetical protein CLF_100348 [Clonorchis sinensis]|uniref:Uncharacterized protein n=1 Tax=Clonorchis sinensis TaxID=79923 RepID=H2KNK4_CLOSI|nr:hypothetical protein CLF_100348 [Clonorchis sinensis]